jgi:hypothetical protein
VVPAHALTRRPQSLLGVALLAGSSLIGCPPPRPGPDAGGDAAPLPAADPTLEFVGRPVSDCTELRFTIALRAGGRTVAVAPESFEFAVTPAAVGDAAAGAERPAANACPAPAMDGEGTTVCLRGLMMDQPYMVRTRVPFDGGQLQLTTYLRPSCAADAVSPGTDAADTSPGPPEAGVDAADVVVMGSDASDVVAERD